MNGLSVQLPTATPSVALDGLRFDWPGASSACLDIPAFEMGPGERVFLHGPSGCGKSTLLAVLSGMVVPQAGIVRIAGTNMTGLPSSARDRLRADHLGIIFQQFNLLPFLSVLDNVLLPCRFSSRRRAALEKMGSDVRTEAGRMLDRLNIGVTLRERRVADLSVGQQQRVAAARALIGQPALVIADEPTSALDSHNQQTFIDLLLAECTAPSSLLLVSHDLRLSRHFDRSIALRELNRSAGAESL